MADPSTNGDGVLAPTSLHGFAYGEHLDGPSQRSLGFRMLAPEPTDVWFAEVETLARRLQSAPYPEHWPTTELFCSVLLDDGQRLVAAARYGVVDHTRSQRRGGLELCGVVGPSDLSVTASLAIYHWLRGRRTSLTDLRGFGGEFDLIEVLAEAPTPPPMGDPVPVLPIRLWQEGALIFAATSATDPDLRLSMLEQTADAAWQWLPLIGSDFPLSVYASRGPLIAWTPHLAGVALKLNQSSVVNTPLVTVQQVGRNGLTMALLCVLIALGGANLFATLRNEKPTPSFPSVNEKQNPVPLVMQPRMTDDGEQFVKSLYRYLNEQGLVRETQQAGLLRHYERVIMTNDGLKVQSPEAKLVIGLLAQMNQRSPNYVRNVIRDVGSKEFNPQVIELLAKLVYQRLADENEGP